MRLLVTGGAGYIGSHACLRLLDEGHEVAVVDDLSRGHRGAIEVLRGAGGDRFAFHEGSITDEAFLREVLAASRAEAVLHFAALAYVGESVERPLDYYRTNVGGGTALLRAMRATGVRRIVFSSTCATYGEPDPGATGISESTPQSPVNPYGESKLCFERLLRAECAVPSATASETAGVAPLAAVALRYFNVVGCDARGRLGEDHRPETHIVPIALEVAIGRRNQVAIFGEDWPTPDGTCIRDYVHVEDLVEAHVLALGALEPGRLRAWNVGTGRGHSVREVIDICRRVTGHPIPAARAQRRAGDPPILFADARASARDLGFKASKPDLETAVRDLWRWMQANPRGYA
jgi:UDP-glucose-4-epimerase GalE